MSDAASRGFNDYVAGSHRNPYDFFGHSEEFREWIAGYRLAKLFEE